MTEALSDLRDYSVFVFVAAGYSDVSALACHRRTTRIACYPRRCAETAAWTNCRHIPAPILIGISDFDASVVIESGKRVCDSVKIVDDPYAPKSEFAR